MGVETETKTITASRAAEFATFPRSGGKPITTNLADLEYHMDPSRPFDVLPLTLADEDKTVLEVLDPKILAVRQIDEDGVSQTIVLGPAQLVHLMRWAGSFLFFPSGVPHIERLG